MYGPGLEALKTVEAILRQVPLVKKAVTKKPPQKDPLSGIGGLVQVWLGPTEWRLVIETRPSGQPQKVRDGIAHLKQYLAEGNKNRDYPVLVAPWLSPESRAICQEAGVGFVDLAGNCRLSFGGLYIERTGFTSPKAEKREFKSLFGAKSAQALRLLLKDPKRTWKLVDLAKSAHISLGQASNIRKALLVQEWAKDSPTGLSIHQPEQVLEAWAKRYKPPKKTRLRLYTLYHGDQLEQRLKTAISELSANQHATLSSFSAARWWAPYARTATEYLYANAGGLERLTHHLNLEQVPSRENVVVDLVRDEGVFLDLAEPIQGLWATSPVQTYLDLSISGERGAEAAEHLLKTKILPQWRPS